MRKRTIATLLMILLVSGLASAETVVFGQEEGWRDVTETERVVLRPGRQGYSDYQLMYQRYEPDDATELLLHFDNPSITDAAGRYRVATQTPEIGTTTHRTGSASLLVDRRDDAVELLPQPGALFRPGVEWGSFTIEFWLYPVVLTDGDVILEWYAHEGADQDFREQHVSVSIEDRRLLFSFENFFQTPEGEPYSVSLHSPRNPIPRRWTHHLVRFDDETALLEYVVDDVPVAITHASATGTEDGSVYFARTAAHPDGGLRLPGAFIGAIDELRITRDYVDQPNLQLYPREGGRLTTGIVDLGSTGARVTAIHATAFTPGRSDVLLSYRLADIRFADPWAPARRPWPTRASSTPRSIPCGSASTPAAAKGRVYRGYRSTMFPTRRRSRRPDCPPCPGMEPSSSSGPVCASRISPGIWCTMGTNPVDTLDPRAVAGYLRSTWAWSIRLCWRGSRMAYSTTLRSVRTTRPAIRLGWSCPPKSPLDLPGSIND